MQKKKIDYAIFLYRRSENTDVQALYEALQAITVALDNKGEDLKGLWISSYTLNLIPLLLIELKRRRN